MKVKLFICAVFCFFSFSIFLFPQEEGENDDFRALRETLANELFPERTPVINGIREAFSKVKREDFIGEDYRSLAYSDMPLPAGNGIIEPAPSMIASILKAAQPDILSKILVIGRNTAYIDAILTRLSVNVYISDPLPGLKRETQINLKTDLSYNVWEEEAPFDVIILFGAVPEIPSDLSNQLKENGILIFPLECPDGNQVLISATKYKDGLSLQSSGKSYIHKLMMSN